MRTSIYRASLAAVLLSAPALWSPPAAAQSAAQAERLLQKAMRQEIVDGDLQAAIEQYKKIVTWPGVDRAVAARALFQTGQCYEKLGQAEARKAYEQLLRQYADQHELVGQARARLLALKSAEPATIAVRRVWAGPDVDTLGAPSRDGAYLTFQDHQNQHLAIRDLATGQKRTLTNKEPRSLEFALASVPSPDGKQVAYAWYNKDDAYDLRLVGVDGSEPRILYSSADVKWPEVTDWSPDGKSVLTVLNRNDRTSQIALVSVVDGSVRPLKSFQNRSPARPRFSPDGRYIAYALLERPEGAAHDLFVLALDGGRETPLVQHPANDIDPDWTPDGKRILFRSDRTGVVSAWWIPVADGKPLGTPELVKADLGRDLRAMGFTRNGSYYYGVRTGMSDVYIAELDLATGKLLSPPSPATQRFVGANDKPDWSRDGRQLLYLSRRGPGAWGARALCVRSTEGGAVRELVSKLDRVSWVRWSPDGRFLLAAAQHPRGEFGIFRIDVPTGDFEHIVELHIGWPAVWSPDGKAIVYYGYAAKRTSLVLRDLETGREKELHSVADPSYYAGGLALSRDGQQLAFLVSEAEGRSKVLKVLPTAGGEARDLLRVENSPWRGPSPGRRMAGACSSSGSPAPPT